MVKAQLGSLPETIWDTITTPVKKTLDTFSIKTVKIAITGLSRAGKTVFITSLIDQLLLQKKIVSVASKYDAFNVKIKPPKLSVSRFDYFSFKKIIKEYHQWPKGTDKITSTTLEIEKKGSRWLPFYNRKIEIELIDYPGEWILDIAMLGLSYEQWSEKVIGALKKMNEERVEEYLSAIQPLHHESGGDALEKNIHTQYVSLLRFLKNSNYSDLTPGRFLMPADLADDPILHFAPIQNNSSPLHAVFKKRYQDYLKNIVENIQLEHFRGFDRQIVLVDIIAALQYGYPSYKDMKQGLRSMLSLYDHRNSLPLFQWLRSSINKVTFVATKADLVSPSQHNNYIALLNEMVEDIRKKLDIGHIQTDLQVVASVKCTQTVSTKHEGKTLSCIRGIDAEKKKPVVIFPGEMPSTFPTPSNWDPANYAFEEFLPARNSYKENEPFDHIHMDKVIESILGDLL